MEADALVVGSGPLGTTVARRLAEHGRTVLILEQGPAISDPPGSHVRNAVRFRTDPDAYLKVAANNVILGGAGRQIREKFSVNIHFYV